MNHPYRDERAPMPDAPEWICSYGCFLCRARAALRRVRLKHAIAVAAALAFATANLATARVSYCYARSGEKMFAAATSLDRAAVAALKRSAREHAAPTTPPTPPSVPPQFVGFGVLKLSDTEFVLERRIVDDVLESQADLMRQTRLVPEMENGKTVGVRLFAVRPYSLLGALGLENGDRLDSINGFEMSRPENALAAYARLRTASDLTVQVQRRGSSMSLHYRIV